MPTIYRKPGFATSKIANPLLSLLNRMGIGPAGSQSLIVRGRKSGKPRRTPVNPLEYQGAHYLVAPRGTTHWVRNLREAGEGDLQLGRRTMHFTAEEVPVEERPPILRAYLDRWGGQTKSHFNVRGDETVEELREIAPLHPVFRLTLHQDADAAHG